MEERTRRVLQRLEADGPATFDDAVDGPDAALIELIAPVVDSATRMRIADRVDRYEVREDRA